MKNQCQVETFNYINFEDSYIAWINKMAKG